MIVKALMAIFGLRAAPPLHDLRVHDFHNTDSAVLGGFRAIASQSRAVTKAMTEQPGNTAEINESIDRMRDVLNEVARRAGR